MLGFSALLGIVMTNDDLVVLYAAVARMAQTDKSFAVLLFNVAEKARVQHDLEMQRKLDRMIAFGLLFGIPRGEVIGFEEV